MNNQLGTNLITTKIQLLKSELKDLKRNIEQLDIALSKLKNRKSELEKNLLYQQECSKSLRNIRNFSIKFI